MNATQATRWPDAGQLAVTFLRYIAEHDGAGEGELHSLFNPAPTLGNRRLSWKNPADVPALEEWHKANEAWKDSAYGSPSIPYHETSSSHRSLVCIALGKAGFVREHNNGYNCYSFTITPAGKAALRSGLVDVSKQLTEIRAKD